MGLGLLWKATALLIAASASAAWLLAGSSTALASCNPSRSGGYLPSGFHYFDGIVATDAGSTLGGVQSDVLDYSPYVSTNGFSSQWVMLKQLFPCQYAQTGWISYGGSAGYRTVFVEHTVHGNQHGCGPYETASDYWYHEYNEGDSAGSFYNLTVTFGNCSSSCSNNANVGDFYHAGTQLGSDWLMNNQSNGDGNWFVPDWAEIEGEIATYSDQMAGGSGSSNHEVFSDSEVWTGGTGGSWVSFGTADPDPSSTSTNTYATKWNPQYYYGSSPQTGIFGNNATSGLYDMIWDNACTS